MKKFCSYIMSAVAASATLYSDVCASEVFYPTRARRLHIEGLVMLSCHVAPDRSPGNCKVIGEKPTGYHFGVAALRMAKSGIFNIAPDLIGTDVSIPVRFDLPNKTAHRPVD